MSKIEELKQVADSIAMHNNHNSSDILIKNDEGSDIINKSEFTNTQVKAVTQVRVLANLTGNDLYDDLVNTFMNAQVSLKRQSRREFIANNQSIKTHEEMKSLNQGGVIGWLNERV